MRQFIKGISTVGVSAAFLSLSACISTSADLCAGVGCSSDATTQEPEITHPTPELTEVVAVDELLLNSPQANYVFNTTEAGTITYSGDCTSNDTVASQGDNTIIIELEWDKHYSNCQITVTSAENKVSLPLDVSPFTTLKTVALNDTGIVYCGDYGIGSGVWTNNANCELADVSTWHEGWDDDGDIVPAGQDALYGRDGDTSLIKTGSGEQGFDFTLQSANGWDCLHDNVTGMTWLINQQPVDTYTWYLDGSGFAGNSATCAGYVSGDPSTYCDIGAYSARVNAQQACGANDWRVPKKEELQSIVHKGKSDSPSIDAFFTDTPIDSNTPDIFYWTSSKDILNPGSSGNSVAVNFKDGSEHKLVNSYPHRVRLVRGHFLAEGAKPDLIYKDNSDGTISDLKTGLMWQKCSIGQSGNDCELNQASKFNWKTAAEEMLLVNNGGFAGHSDWRLPSINELYSLVDDNKYQPSINEDIFPQTEASHYWSSSPYLYKSAVPSENQLHKEAWTVSFEDGIGQRSDKTLMFYLRLVRDID